MTIINSDLSVNSVKTMDFSTLVGIVREPNMCSGGVETLRMIIKESNLKHDAKILEVGSNTGFSSIEFASTMPHASVVGIDINPISVEFAKKKADQFNVSNVEFIHSDARSLPFENDSFDMVFVSNVTSFINEREQAIQEYLRVLKPGGILAAAPIYYRITPPGDVVKSVEEAINAHIDIWGKSYWENLFSNKDLQLYFSEDYKYIVSTEEAIKDYVDMVMSQEHLNFYSSDLKKALGDRLQYFYELFDHNLSYAGFSIFLYRYKSPNNIPILHKTCLAKNESGDVV